MFIAKQGSGKLGTFVHLANLKQTKVTLRYFYWQKKSQNAIQVANFFRTKIINSQM